MHLKPIVAALGCLFLMAGCASVPLPDFELLRKDAPPTWAAATQTTDSSAQTLRWWESFSDPLLTKLVDHAVVTSPTVGEAMARLVQARGQAGMSAAQGLPSLTVQAQPRASAGTDSAVTETRSAGLAASWEIDLFGRLSLDKSAAAARAQGAERAAQQIKVVLAADVATAYFNRRQCERQLTLASEDLEARKTLLGLTEKKVAAGIAAPADLIRTQASVHDAMSILRGQQGACERSLNQLVALTGMVREDLVATLAAPAMFKTPVPPAIPVPARAVAQRPDVQNAEQQVLAAAAGVGVAKADFLPRLTLSGVISTLATGPVGAAHTAIQTWSFASGLTAPLWDNGQRKGALTVAEGKYEETLAAYQGLVRTAVRETEDALSRLAAADDQMALSYKAADGYERNFAVVQARYRHGAASLLDVEDSRRQLLAAQQSAATAFTERRLAHVALYRALGGGF